ncbi:hypothetical protein ACFFX0_32590 [Citricoccus parietis]|uniref:Uncharacterized protein n=1 Tax=Citricoccus parietis TaxID=592307 RepID=A0ABV5GAK9_9MICC
MLRHDAHIFAFGQLGRRGRDAETKGVQGGPPAPRGRLGGLVRDQEGGVAQATPSRNHCGGGLGRSTGRVERDRRRGSGGAGGYEGVGPAR